MRKRDLSGMFEPGSGYVPYSWENKQRVCAPNSMYYKRQTEVAIIVSWRSSVHGTFAVNAEALKSMRQADEKGRIKKGYVVIAEGNERDPKYIAQCTLAEMLREVRSLPARPGTSGYSDFWVMKDDMIPIPSAAQKEAEYQARFIHEDAPF